MRVAVLGLGEAGSIYASDLVDRGADVIAVDLIGPSTPEPHPRASDIAEAVTGADLVLSLVGARSAPTVLAEALPAMSPSATYADMNTASPEEKKRLAGLAAGRGIAFADVAILAPVPRARADTALMVSGAGAERAVAIFASYGMPATFAGGQAGAAAGMKLLRSVFMKGLAALAFESVEAADAVGERDWVIAQMASELGPNGHELIEHLLAGTTRHAVRRETEMRDVQAYLDSLGAAHPMTDATVAWLGEIARRPTAGDPV